MSTPSRTFDPCTPVRVDAPAATDDERASIAAAIAMWRAVDLTAPDNSGATAITVTFEPAAPDTYGFYDDGAIYINVELDAAPRSIAIAHELGHAFGLVHVAPEQRLSVMNAGNLTVAPTTDDRAAIAAIWGACASAPPATAR